MNTSLIPLGVRQGNEKKLTSKKQDIEPGDQSLDKLDAFLREQTMASKEEKINGGSIPHPTYRDTHFNNTNSKLGNFDSTVKQQFSLQNDITAAMAANTIQNKKELWRIEQLNQSAAQLGTQFGWVEASKDNIKKGQKSIACRNIRRGFKTHEK